MRKLMIGAIFGLAATGANASVLDFESFSAGTVINAFSVDGITGSVAAVGGSNQAMVFDTDNPTGNDDDLAAPFFDSFTGPAPAGGTPAVGAGELNPGKVLIISGDGDAGDPDDNAGGGTITFTFDQAVTFNGFDVFDDVSNFLVSANGGAFTLAAINMDYDNQFTSVTGIGWEGVTSLVFDFGQASGAIDSIDFSIPTQVPVPASLPLLAFGLGAFGYIARRRRN